MASSIYELYGEIWGEIDHEVEFDVRQSLAPRNPNLLFEMFGGLALTTKSTVLDVGCRDGIYAVELARRFNCPVIALDPVPLNIEKAKKLVSKVSLEHQIEAKIGCIEALPLDDESVDYVWCRDVLIHVDLPKGLAECFRVLQPGGAILIYNVFATPFCEEKEAKLLFDALSIVPANMSEEYFETTAQEIGFEIQIKDKVDSEWYEASIEIGAKDLVDHLLFAARMRRAKEPLILKYGKNRYEANYAVCLWELYPLLGKLCPTIYLLRKPLKSQ